MRLISNTPLLTCSWCHEARTHLGQLGARSVTQVTHATAFRWSSNSHCPLLQERTTAELLLDV